MTRSLCRPYIYCYRGKNQQGETKVKEDENLKPDYYTHLRVHETGRKIVCRILHEKKKSVNA